MEKIVCDKLDCFYNKNFSCSSSEDPLVNDGLCKIYFELKKSYLSFIDKGYLVIKTNLEI